MRGILAWMRHSLSQSAFLRSILILAGGTALGQGVVVLFAPILTRIYTPADFGVLATFASIISVVVVMLSLRYEQAVVLPEQRQVAIALLGLSLSLVFALSFTMAIALWIKRDALLRLGGFHADFFWLLPLGFVGAGLYQVMNFWALRELAFEHIARTRLAQSLGMVLTQLGLGVAGLGSVGLLVGEVVGRVGGSWSLLVLLRGVTLQELFDVQKILYAAKRYLRFPLYNAWAALLNTLSLQLPFLMLPSLFNNEVAGFFALAYRVLGLPSFLVGQAVGQAFLSKAAALQSAPEELAGLTTRTALGLLALGVAVFGIVAIGGAGLFGVFFGESWRQAGVYAQIMAPWYMLWLVSSPLSGLLAIREWQGAGLAFTVVELLTRGLALWVGAGLRSDVLTVVLVALAGVAISLTALIWFLRAGYVDLGYIGPRALSLLGIGLVYTFFLWALTEMLGLWGLLGAIPMAGLGSYLWVKRGEMWGAKGVSL
ncbi:Polysaccharide biosynthesis protein [Calidithermus roseus]|uniref:Polysaccharide biosynthesis protein n=2 Tax=Calidithermus roseus TaxID=1644118 RepID=A0A399EK50_9DEIN|nr:Polysaccharide biosynthesis protein [Calidithermus roseus]